MNLYYLCILETSWRGNIGRVHAYIRLNFFIWPYFYMLYTFSSKLCSSIFFAKLYISAASLHNKPHRNKIQLTYKTMEICAITFVVQWLLSLIYHTLTKCAGAAHVLLMMAREDKSPNCSPFLK